MLDALKCYLESWGYPDIYVDTVPAPGEQRDMIALLEWDHTVGEVNDGTGTHYIQVQVRARPVRGALSPAGQRPGGDPHRPDAGRILHCTAGQRAAQAGIRRRIHHILLGIGPMGPQLKEDIYG